MSTQIQSNNENLQTSRKYVTVKKQMDPVDYAKYRKFDRHKKDENNVRVPKQNRSNKYKSSMAKLNEEQRNEKKRKNAEYKRNRRLKAKVKQYEITKEKSDSMNLLEISQKEVLKNQEVLIDWKTNKISSPEDKEKITNDVEELSPITLRKSVIELKDAQFTVKSSNKRCTKSNVYKEMKSRQEKNEWDT